MRKKNKGKKNQQRKLEVKYKNYNGIDVVKFICSILVFLIHIPLLNAPVGDSLSEFAINVNFGLQNYICRIAVPFFFACAGFLFFSKMPEDNLNIDRLKNYSVKIFRLIGIWSVLLYIGGDFHLWYLGAAVVAITFICLCLKFNIKYSYLFLIACFLYVLGLIGDSYYGFIRPLMSEPVNKYLYDGWKLLIGRSRNGLFMGTIFVLIGAIFAKKKIKINFGTSVFWFIASMCCLGGEVYLLRQHKMFADYNMYIFLIPAVFFLFYIAYNIKLKDRPIYEKLRTIGLLIYFLHIMVNKLVLYVIDGVNKFFYLDLNPYRCFIVFAITLLLAICIERLSHKERTKWIKWFIS